MTLTTLQKTQLNNSNAAMQRAAVGTLLGTFETDIANIEADIAEIQAGTMGVVVKQSVTVGFAQFTDGGAAVGTFATPMTIPAKATFLYSAVTAVTGFTGDTSAALQIGDGSTVARYNTSTIDVFATAANGVSAGAPSGTVYHTAEKTVTLTITSATDWGAVNAGSVTVSVYYLA